MFPFLKLPAELRDLVRDHLSLSDTLHLGSACTLLRKEQWRSRKWDVDLFLRDAYGIVDGARFREVLRTVDACLAGLGPLMFLAGEYWEYGAKLNVVVKADEHDTDSVYAQKIAAICEHLASAGYVPSGIQIGLGRTLWNHELQAMCYVTTSSDDNLEGVIPRRSLIQYLPAGSFIYHDRVECLFPYSTLVQRVLLRVGDSSFQHGILCRRLRSKGWTEWSVESSTYAAFDKQPRLQLRFHPTGEACSFGLEFNNDVIVDHIFPLLTLGGDAPKSIQAGTATPAGLVPTALRQEFRLLSYSTPRTTLRRESSLYSIE